MRKLARVVVGIISACVFCEISEARIDAHRNPNAQEFRNYISAAVGVGRNRYYKFKDTNGSYVNKSPKVTAMYQVRVGRRYKDTARGEFSLQYGQVRYKAQSQELLNLRQKIKLFGATLNGYYDINLNRVLSPYLTAGGGIGINKAQDLVVDNERLKGKSTTCFIWNAGLGARVKFKQRWALDLGYKFMYLGKVRSGDSNTSTMFGEQGKYIGGTQKIYGNQFLLAANYSF